MKKILIMSLIVCAIWVGRAFGQNALFVHDVVPDCNSGFVKAACLDAGLSFDEQTTLPADLTPYDVIIVYTNADHGEWADPLRGFIENGGGLLTLGATPLYLGMPDYIGASVYITSGGLAKVLIDMPAFGLHADDVVQSSNNADPEYRCAAAALTELAPGAIEIAGWDPNPNGAECYYPATYSLAYPFGDGWHVYWGDFWQYSAVRGIISFLSR